MKKPLLKTILITALFSLNISNIAKAQWQQTCVGSGVKMLSMTTSGTNLFVGSYGGGVIFSADSGATCSTVNTGLSNLYVYALATSGANLFAGTDAGVFLSSNNGTSWTAVTNGMTSSKFVRSLAISGTKIFAGTTPITGYGLFLSTNNGSSWSQVNTGLPVKTYGALAISGSNLFVGTSGSGGSGVYISSNNGTSWTAVNTGLTNLEVNALAVSGSNLYAGTLGGVFVSANNGSSWTATSLTLPVYSLAISGSKLFAGVANGYGDAVYMSTDNGGSWSAQNSGLQATQVNAMTVMGSKLYAAVNASIVAGGWSRPLSDMIGINSFSKQENISIYPNPAKDQLSIELFDNKNTIVEIISLDGQLLQSVLLQTTKATLSVADLANGVYMLKIKNASGVSVQKFIKD